MKASYIKTIFLSLIILITSLGVAEAQGPDFGKFSPSADVAPQGNQYSKDGFLIEKGLSNKKKKKLSKKYKKKKAKHEKKEKKKGEKANNLRREKTFEKRAESP